MGGGRKIPSPIIIMITVTHFDQIITECDSIAGFVLNRFECSFNADRQLTLSGEALRHYKNQTQIVTTHSYGDNFSIQEAVNDWANSGRGRAYLAQLDYHFYREV